MSEFIGAGDWRLFFLHRDRLRKVTTDDVAARRGEVLQAVESHRWVCSSRRKQPDRAEIPATPDVAAMLKDYKGDAAIAAGEAFDPSPANIETRTSRKRRAVRAEAWRCCPKKTRGGTVVAQLDAALSATKRA